MKLEDIKKELEETKVSFKHKKTLSTEEKKQYLYFGRVSKYELRIIQDIYRKGVIKIDKDVLVNLELSDICGDFYTIGSFLSALNNAKVIKVEPEVGRSCMFHKEVINRYAKEDMKKLDKVIKFVEIAKNNALATHIFVKKKRKGFKFIRAV